MLLIDNKPIILNLIFVFEISNLHKQIQIFGNLQLERIQNTKKPLN